MCLYYIKQALTSKEYQFYTTRDFALDEDFQNWVLHPCLKNKYFWQAWLREYPHKQATINEAVALVRSVQFRSYTLPDNEKERLWDSVWDKMNQEEAEIPYKLDSPKKLNNWRNVWKYAAAVFIGMIAIFSIWRITDHEPAKTISLSAQTGYGEVRKLVLPDSSEVILNANSGLIYKESGQQREVWLNGEACFQVKHTFGNKKFIVETDDKLSVEVLGTRFNVNNRGQQIKVVLQRGSIKLNISERPGNITTQLYLKPGEMISYDKQDGDYAKSKVDAAQFDSWATGKLAMNNYSLTDVASFMQQVFGKKMIISDHRLLNNRISGSMPIVYNVDTMLVQFGKVFQVDFHKQDDEILVHKQAKGN